MGKIFHAIWIIVVIGVVIAFLRVNNIHNFEDAWSYGKSWGDKFNSCLDKKENSKETVGWKCGSKPDSINPITPGEKTNLPDSEVKDLDKSLNALPVKNAETVAYSRAQWHHWSDLDHNGCDSREDVLLKQGTNVKTSPSDKCKAVSGVWVSPYENKKITDPRALDIDHVVPLGYAAKHGGQNWSTEKKEAFANDFSQLLATSAFENRSKSDKGPGEYMPPDRNFKCAYAKIWIKTTTKYGLFIDRSDKAALSNALKTC